MDNRDSAAPSANLLCRVAFKGPKITTPHQSDHSHASYELQVTRYELRITSYVLALTLVLAGCAAPGDPRPPQPIVPKAITDLAARQAGDGVALTFTLPKESVENDPLDQPPAVEIFRAVLPPGQRTTKVKTELVYTIPSALVETYLEDGRMRFVDPIHTEQLSASGAQMVYLARTRAARWRSSPDSNVVTVRVFAPPEPVTGLRATVTETSIELTWSPPSRLPAGASLAGYRVYRVVIEAEAGPDARKPQLKSAPELLGPTSSTSYRDSSIDLGRTYLYQVSSVAQYEADSVESSLSAPLEVVARDTFPPATPQNLVAVYVPGTPQAPAHVELSWSISPESDWAGYRVYRSEQPDAPGQPRNADLLLSPTFRDMSVVPGRPYTYRVTSVDRAGNESAPSAAALVEVPAP